MNPHIHNYIEARTKEKKLEVLVERAEMKLRKHREKTHSWIQMVAEPIAKELCEYTGHRYFEIYGPFGLRAETTIYLMDREDLRIYEKPTWSITLTPDFSFVQPEPDFRLFYDTGNIREVYPRNSIGGLNNFGHETALLPDTIEEIAKLLVYSGKEMEEE